MEKYRTAFEVYSNCTLTAFYIFLRHSNSIRNILIAFEGVSKRQATSNPARMSRMCLEWAGMHLKCISIAAGIYFDNKIIQLEHVECTSNAVGIFRLPLECGSNAVGIGPDWPANESERNSEHRRIANLGMNSHSDGIPAHSASSVTRVWNSLPNVARILKILHSGWFCLIPADSE